MVHRKCSTHGWYSQPYYEARFLSISCLLVALIDSSKPINRVGENWMTWGMIAENHALDLKWKTWMGRACGFM